MNLTKQEGVRTCRQRLPVGAFQMTSCSALSAMLPKGPASLTKAITCAATSPGTP